MDAFRIRNVHSIAEMGFVPLRPLTIVVGRNSAGKSSLVRWLPLLAQSLDSPGSAPILWSRRDRGLVDYGSFQETLRRGAQPGQIHFEWMGQIKGQRFTSESVLALHERATYLAALNIEIGDATVSLRVSPEGAIQELSINGAPLQHLAPEWTPVLGRPEIIPSLSTRAPPGMTGEPGLPERADALGSLTQGRPSLLRRAGIASTARGWTSGALRQALLAHELGTPTWRSDLAAMSDDDPRLKALIPLFAVGNLAELFTQIRSQLRQVLVSLVYVAPFRAEPRRAERSPEPSTTLDARGEALLSFVEGLSPTERDDLSSWLQATLGFKLILKKEGLYSELRIDQGDGGDDNLSDVGFGIGQVLPVAVHLWRAGTGLDAEPDTIVVMEQPELHLHPRQQAAVGRMLAVHAKANRQRGGRLLVETHSEVLINAVGEEIASGQTIRAEDVAVVAFERPKGGGPATIRTAEFDDRGYLQEPWPFDFFAAR